MNQPTVTPDNIKSALKARLDQHTAEMRAQSRAYIDAMEESIRSKEMEHAAVMRGVNQHDAAELIVSSIRQQVQPRLARLEAEAAAAVRLDRHGAPVNVFGFNAGGISFSEQEVPFKPLGHDASPWDLLALLWDESAITKFANRVVIAAGAPASGKSVEELRADAKRLTEELAVLHGDRAEARETFNGFIEIPVMLPLTEEEMEDKRAEKTQPLVYASKGPSVRIRDVNGNLQPQAAFGHSFEDLMAARAELDRAETRNRIAAGEIYADNGSLLDDRR